MLTTGSVNDALAQDAGGSDPDLGEAALFQELPAVTAASRYDQDPYEAPASISIVTADDIRRYGYRTLAEVLNSVRGFFTTYDRNYSYVTARGFGRPGDYNTRILFLVDGHRLNDNVADAGYVGTEAVLDVNTIERVEVIRGPSSSLYGTNAFFGVVNVITRQGRWLGGTRVSAEAGSFDSYRGRIAYGAKVRGGLEVLATGSVYRSGGADLFFPEFNDPATNNGLAVDRDGDRAETAFGKVVAGDFTVAGGLSSRRKGIPTASYETTFDDARTRTKDQRAFAFVAYDRALPGLSRLGARLSYDRNRYSGAFAYDDVVQRDYQRGDWWTLETQYIRPLGSRHKLIAGGEFRWNVRQEQGVFDEAPFVTYLSDARTSRVWALFVQDEFRVARRLMLNAGIRRDDYETFGATVNPRLAVIYGAGTPTSIKAMYGRAFRAPNAFELYYHDGGVTQKPSAGLEPETIESFELVAEHRFAPTTRASASLYHLDVEDLITLGVDPADSLSVFRNVDRQSSTGVELEGEARLVGRLEGRASYAYQRSNDPTTGLDVVNSPRHLGRLGVSVPWWSDHARVGFELRGMSGRRTLAGDTAPGFAVGNLTLLGRPFRHSRLELAGSVYNLWNHRYGDPAGEEHVQTMIGQDGRTYRLSLRYQF